MAALYQASEASFADRVWRPWRALDGGMSLKLTPELDISYTLLEGITCLRLPTPSTHLPIPLYVLLVILATVAVKKVAQYPAVLVS